MLTKKVTQTFSIKLGPKKSRATKTRKDEVHLYLHELGIDEDNDAKYWWTVYEDKKANYWIKVFNCPVEEWELLEDKLQKSKRKWIMLFEMGS